MSLKQEILLCTLFVLSMFVGFTLAGLDIFGFLAGGHTLNIVLLLSSLSLWYLLVLTVFLLTLSEVPYGYAGIAAATFLFGAASLLGHETISFALLASVCFGSFLVFSYHSLQQRTRLFLKFNAQQVFTPIAKSSFIFIIMIFALLSYGETSQRIQSNKLLGPNVIRPITRPFVTIVNTQLTNQISSQLNLIPSGFQLVSKQQLAKLAVTQILNALTDSGRKDFFGLPGSTIDSNKIAVSTQGEIDIQPLVEDIIPQIATLMNERLGAFASFIPLVIAFIVILILQPIIYLFELALYIPTPLIFKLLVTTGFAHLEKETVEREQLVI